MSTTLTRPRPHSPPAAEAIPPAPAAPRPGPERLASLDAYRGFIMLVMASGGFAFSRVARDLEQKTGRPSVLWDFLGYQFDHVPWVGCAFWDLIQPSFMFMVGVALPFSLAGRRARGDSPVWSFAHAAWRAVLLILLAVFLSSPLVLSRDNAGFQGPTTNWIFVNVLAQIGLGYLVVYLLTGQGWKVQLGALLFILIGYTLFFGLWPAPATEVFDHAKVLMPGDADHLMTGWFAHWNKNANAAHGFDVWFLNLFPRPEPFVFNQGGYQTLNFVPSLATMILGLMAGELLISDRTKAQKFLGLSLAAAGCLAIGWLMGLFVCPIVKRIWTPSWAVFSAGWTFAMLAGFYGVIDVVGWKRWAFPLVVVGMNSIAIYVMSQLIKGWIGRSLQIHLGRSWFGGDYGPIVLSVSVLAVLWLICFWMYRRKLFLRI